MVLYVVKMATVQLLFLTILVVSIYATNPIIEISDGKLRGSVGKDLNGNNFYSFRSVPFAKPPLGKNRFKDPKPVEKWEGIRNALEDLPICFQKQWGDLFTGSEDCLYLNVHTPMISPKHLNPVMVFIHGGGFTEGTGRHDFYGPEFLMIEEVVLVTINYRLGVLGFMNFENPELNVPGNAALKDQLMALKWVNKNIQYFGGDPKKVTIFGQSAGGASVHLHVLSPLSQGYFHRAIAMSGVALSAWCNGIQNNGPHIAKRLGYQGNDEFEMLDTLQQANFDQLKIALENSTILVPLNVPNLFGPTVEKQNMNAFLPDTPRNLIKKAAFKRVPFMVGMADKEGMVFDVLYFLRYGKYDPFPVSYFIPYFFDVSGSERENLENEIKSFYFHKQHSIYDDINLATDSYFTWSIYDTILGHLTNQQDVFFYVFSSDTKMNRFKRQHPVTAKYKGACHVDDLGYLLPGSESPRVNKSSIEDTSIRVTTRLFANFAKYGQPTKNDFNVAWKNTNSKTLNYVDIINNEIKVGHAPFNKRADFWCKLFKKYKPDMEMFCYSRMKG